MDDNDQASASSPPVVAAAAAVSISTPTTEDEQQQQQQDEQQQQQQEPSSPSVPLLLSPSTPLTSTPSHNNNIKNGNNNTNVKFNPHPRGPVAAMTNDHDDGSIASIKASRRPAEATNAWYESPMWCWFSGEPGTGVPEIFYGAYSNNIISTALFMWTFFAIGANILAMILGMYFITASDGFIADKIFGLFSIVLALPVATARKPGWLRSISSIIGVGMNAAVLGRQTNMYVQNDAFNTSTIAFVLPIYFTFVSSVQLLLTVWCAFLNIGTASSGNVVSSCSDMAEAAVNAFQYGCSVASWRPPAKTLAEWRNLPFVVNKFSPDVTLRRKIGWCCSLFAGLNRVIEVSRLDLLGLWYGPLIGNTYQVPNVPLELAPGVESPPLPSLMLASIGLTIGVCVPIHILILLVAIHLFNQSNVADNPSVVFFIYIMPVLPVYLSLWWSARVMARAQVALRRGRIQDEVESSAYGIVKLRGLPYQGASFAIAEQLPALQALTAAYTLFILFGLGFAGYYMWKAGLFSKLAQLVVEHFVDTALYVLISTAAIIVTTFLLYSGLFARHAVVTHPFFVSILSPILVVAYVISSVIKGFFRVISGLFAIFFIMPFPNVSMNSMIPRWDASYRAFWSVVAVDAHHNNPLLLNFVAIMLAQNEIKKMTGKKIQAVDNNNETENLDVGATVGGGYGSTADAVRTTSQLELGSANRITSYSHKNQQATTAAQGDDDDYVREPLEDDLPQNITSPQAEREKQPPLSSERNSDNDNDNSNENNDNQSSFSFAYLGRDAYISVHAILRSLCFLHLLRAHFVTVASTHGGDDLEREHADYKKELFRVEFARTAANDILPSNMKEEDLPSSSSLSSANDSPVAAADNNNNNNPTNNNNSEQQRSGHVDVFNRMSRAQALKCNMKRQVELAQLVEVGMGSRDEFFAEPSAMLKQATLTRVQRRWWMFWYLTKYPFLRQERKHVLKVVTFLT